MIESSDESRSGHGPMSRAFTSSRLVTIARIALVALVGILPACNPAPKDDWKIEPRKRVGALLSTGSEADLRKAYGSANVAPVRIELGEGQTTTGTVLFPGDSLHRMEILWQDSLAREIPARVILRGGRSAWKLPGDVSLGLSIADLERRNGRPFTLAGFGWDYEGIVVSWEGGAMDTSLTPDVKIYLGPEPAARSRPEYSRVLGDRPYPSSLPEMRALDPRVYQVFVDFQHLPSPGESEHAPQYEIRESDQGKTFRFDTTTRFSLILDEQKHPQRTLRSIPQGIVGRESNVPDVEPRLYAARFEAVQPGTCQIVAKDFSVRIIVVEKPDRAMKADTTRVRSDTAAVKTGP
jgi:hypothetical protein